MTSYSKLSIVISVLKNERAKVRLFDERIQIEKIGGRTKVLKLQSTNLEKDIKSIARKKLRNRRITISDNYFADIFKLF